MEAHGGEFRHSGYLGTAADINAALMRLNAPPTSGNGYIYHIRAITSFVDVNATLGQFSPFPNEHEIAALGIIRWDQIIGWEQFIGGVPRPFVANFDYRANMWGTLESSGAQYQLAGFPPNHIAWSMDPWRDFANCGGKKKSGCYPKKPAQRTGEEFFWTGYRKEVGMWLIVIEAPED